MEQEPQNEHPRWETFKNLGGLGGSTVLMVGGGAASAEFFSRGTPEGALGGSIMLVVALGGLHAILDGRG